MVNFNVCMVTRYFSAKARIIDKYTHAFEFIHRTLQFSNVIYMLHLSEQRPHSRSLTVARSICSRSLSHVRSALARCRTFDLLSLAHRSHFSTRSLAHILTCIARSLYDLHYTPILLNTRVMRSRFHITLIRAQLYIHIVANLKHLRFCNFTLLILRLCTDYNALLIHAQDSRGVRVRRRVHTIR